VKYDGYNVHWFDYTSDHDGGKRFGVIVEDLRRFDSRTLSGYASIPERDAAVREWIEQQESKPVIVAGPVVRSLTDERGHELRLIRVINNLRLTQSAMRPNARADYDDDANYMHSQRIYRERFNAVTELIASYQTELFVVQSQLQELEKHGGS